ncbi:MAG: LPS assembly protein LptD, partial [Alphaproteobacteria bacterium]|nr:LPS assembly protein LptD [Alphaproteobacteria bacterium]
WQIKAEKVVHDEDKRTLTYRDATLELLGVPILYTPWFQHPDVTVDRASGFLTPDFGSSSILGLTVEIPYYFNLAPNKDLTLAPLLTTDERAALLFEYRHRLSNGTFQFSGSGTYVSERDFENNKIPGNEFRGHLFGEGRFDLKGGWGWGFDVEVASDDTFLRRYDFSRADSLVNRLFIENIDGRNYFNATAYAFQGLRAEDDAGMTPIAAPYVRYSYVSAPSWLGGHFEVDSDLLMLTRTDGLDTGRGGVNASWQIPYTSPFGELYKLTVGVRGDVYYLRDRPAPGQPDATLGDDFEARAIPYIALDWKLPFIRRGKNSQQIIEPIIQVVASPTGVNDMDIPNEDSLSFDFDTTNLFQINRFAGTDVWEPGARVAYGVKFTQFTDNGTRASILVGQSYRFSDEEVMPADSGLRNNLSDIVIGASLSVPNAFHYEHRLRLDKDDFSITRNEGAVIFGPEDYRFSIGYTEVNRNGFDPLLRDREEVRTAAKVKLSRYWSASADFSYDFEPQGGVLTTGGALTYEDECFKFRLRARRDFTSDREVRPETSIGFQLVFKAVGDNTQ